MQPPRPPQIPTRAPGGSRLRVRKLSQPQPTAPGAAAPTAWQDQATWYDQRHGASGDDMYDGVLLPAVVTRLAASKGQRVLDICCGQGVLGRRLAAAGVKVTGIDAAPALIDMANKRAGSLETYLVGDARSLQTTITDGPYDHGAIVMALQDLDAMHLVLAGACPLIKPGGRLVIALTHPCFRIPKRSSWVVDERSGVRYRRLDSYLSPHSATIRTHPGQGEESATTTSFHRPLGAYVNALVGNRMAVIGLDELVSPRRGSPGRNSGAEDRATMEFPLFAVLTAVRM